MKQDDERGRAFRRAFWELAVLLIAAVAISGGLWALQTHFENQAEAKDEEITALIAQERVLSQREGCRRGNKGVRSVLYNFLVDAENARRASARQTDDPRERKTDLEAARGYAHGQSKMIEAAKGHAIEPGSPIVDCQKAYPFQPTPFEGG